MSVAPPTMEELRAINSAFPFPEPMRRWKERGGQILGWGCTYVPEEIIRAAGLLPVRMTGAACEAPTDDADAYLYTNSCSYARAVLQSALEGQFDFLAGYVTAASCDSMRRLLDNWQHCLSTPFLHVLALPHKATERAENLFFEELVAFKAHLEESFGVKITDQTLRETIQLHNRTRRLLSDVHALRKAPNPPIAGEEAFEVVNAGIRMPREEYNELLTKLLGEARPGEAGRERRLRLMLCGSSLGNPDFIAGIEAQGAVVVVDDLCTGVRYWSDLVDEDPKADPLRALTRRYLNNLPCARTVGLASERHRRLLALAREYSVDGAVIATIRNCMPNGMERPQLREQFEDAGIPVLELDTEYGSGRTGQVATRVQAFLEMLHAMVND